MAIESIRLSNFKSFADLSVQLGSFNVIVGSNASGKSNFVSVLRFLRDTTTNDLDNAISLQGGVRYLRNINIGASKPLSIEIAADRERRVFLPGKGLEPGFFLDLVTRHITHKMVLTFRKRRLDDYEVAESLVEMVGQLALQKSHGNRIEKVRELGAANIRFQMLGGRPNYFFRAPEAGAMSEQPPLVPFMPDETKKRLVYGHIPMFVESSEDFRDIGLYDIDPKLPKKSVAITSRPDLTEDGSNLALVLKAVTEDNAKSKMFASLIRDLLPFVDKVAIDKLADKSMMFKVKEKYFTSEFLPGSLVSDGTISIAALILALYFGTKSTIVLEEPERNIHPSLIARAVEMMKDASRNRQVILTTHNPEVVKHAGIDSLLLISRDELGYSTIVKPSEQEQVKVFLQNEIGVEDLFAQDLLGA